MKLPTNLRFISPNGAARFVIDGGKKPERNSSNSGAVGNETEADRRTDVEEHGKTCIRSASSPCSHKEILELSKIVEASTDCAAPALK